MLLLIPIAFLSGVLTVFSPCVLPILPIILTSGIDGNIKRIRGVIAGLVVSFTAASLLLATLVRTLGVPADTVRNFAVGLLVIFGISLIFPKIWESAQGWVERLWRFQPKQSNKDGFWGGFLTGVSLGVVWTPCIGPVVAAVATLAAVSAFSVGAVFIALAYALGAGVPLYFIAKGGSSISQKLGFVKSNNQIIRQIFGWIVLGTALFIYAGVDRTLQAWTLGNLPESWTQLATTFEERFNIEDEIDDLKSKTKEGSTGSSELEGKVVVRQVNLQSDYTGAKVDKSDLLQGCFGQDCIPAIDNPIFESAREGDAWLNDDDRVFAIDYEGVVRAYPQRILNWHEIVNDVFELDSGVIKYVAITFCPLCGSALAFERVVDGVITEFGVSGKLHNNDLVMYDRYEGNLWQQITGEAIVGPAARRDEVLRQVPIITVPWRQWLAEHPDTEVLSRDTGHTRNYDQYPYGTYEQDDNLLFGIPDVDKSLQIKTVVYGIEVGEFSKAYPENVFEVGVPIEDTVGGVSVTLEQEESGQIMVTNNDTGEEIIPIRLFWFAWAAFHPGTELFQPN